MSRGQARFLIAGVVLLLFAVVGHGLMNNNAASERNDPGFEAPLPTTAEQRMQNFRRVKIRPDGQKAWEIVARQARYLTEDHLVIVEAPEFSFYPKDSEAFSLKSREARVVLTADKKEEVMRVELNGNLEMQVGDFIIKTETAVFETEQNRISSTSAVQINGPGVEVAGQGYAVDVVNKHLTLEADVQTTLTRRES